MPSTFGPSPACGVCHGTGLVTNPTAQATNTTDSTRLTNTNRLAVWVMLLPRLLRPQLLIELLVAALGLGPVPLDVEQLLLQGRQRRRLLGRLLPLGVELVGQVHRLGHAGVAVGLVPLDQALLLGQLGLD